MGVLREIMAVTDCTFEEAQMIRDYMDEEFDVDYSEVTIADLRAAILEANANV